MRPPLTTAFLDLAHDAAAFVADGRMTFPVFLELGLFVGEDDGTFLVFEFLDEDINFLADFNFLDVDKFIGGDDTLALIADVHEDFLGSDFDDGTFENLALGVEFAALLQGFFHCEHNFYGDELRGGLRVPKGT